MRKLFALFLALLVLLSSIMSINVVAAETEVDGGNTTGEATTVSLYEEYFVKVDNKFMQDYFIFETDDDGYYEVIGTSNDKVFSVEILSYSEKYYV